MPDDVYNKTLLHCQPSCKRPVTVLLSKTATVRLYPSTFSCEGSGMLTKCNSFGQDSDEREYRFTSSFSTAAFMTPHSKSTHPLHLLHPTHHQRHYYCTIVHGRQDSGLDLFFRIRFRSFANSNAVSRHFGQRKYMAVEVLAAWW
jgi:hypothetical protein